MHKAPHRTFVILAVSIATLVVFGVGLRLMLPDETLRGFELELPIACTPGADCFIQNYVDVDPGSGAMDYRCGPLTYDGHKGTDFRLRSLAAMRAGVDVLASAPGTVKGVRDEMPDTGINRDDLAAVKDRECGNGVVVDHGDGWETQYCHMKRGSITVAPGSQVHTGQILGQVGLSGLTEFPHVHLSVRKDGAVIDPFIGDAQLAGCTVARHPLWSAAAEAQVQYIPTAILQSGFAADTPDAVQARNGDYANTEIGPDAPLLAYWIDLYGLMNGDIVTLTLRTPTGEVLAKHNSSYDKNMAALFTFIGKKLGDTPWPAGVYRGEATVVRSGAGKNNPVASASATFTIPSNVTPTAVAP